MCSIVLQAESPVDIYPVLTACTLPGCVRSRRDMRQHHGLRRSVTLTPECFRQVRSLREMQMTYDASSCGFLCDAQYATVLFSRIIHDLSVYLRDQFFWSQSVCSMYNVPHKPYPTIIPALFKLKLSH